MGAETVGEQNLPKCAAESGLSPERRLCGPIPRVAEAPPPRQAAPVWIAAWSQQSFHEGLEVHVGLGRADPCRARLGCSVRGSCRTAMTAARKQCLPTTKEKKSSMKWALGCRASAYSSMTASAPGFATKRCGAHGTPRPRCPGRQVKDVVRKFTSVSPRWHGGQYRVGRRRLDPRQASTQCKLPGEIS